MSASVLRPLKAGILITLLLVGTSFAETYRIDRGHSSVEFSIRYMVSRVTGRFEDFQGSIVYDPEQVDKSSVEVTIRVASINTNNERRDGHLRTPDFFDAENYPEITFKSTKVEKQDDRLLVTGDLTMHGVTKSVALPVNVVGVGTHPRRQTPLAGFEAALPLKRSDFDVDNWTDGINILGDEVKIALNIQAGGGRGGAWGGGRGMSPERLEQMQARMFERFPDLKAEFDRRVNDDPELATDARKWRAFMREMREKGIVTGDRGGGRRRGN